jgi:hypothetical protein
VTDHRCRVLRITKFLWGRNDHVRINQDRCYLYTLKVAEFLVAALSLQWWNWFIIGQTPLLKRGHINHTALWK